MEKTFGTKLGGEVVARSEMKKKSVIGLLLLLLVFSQKAEAQWSSSFEVMPKLTYAKFVGKGVVPASYKLNKLTPSISFGGYLNRRITKNKEVFFGFNYHFNNYRSVYMRDYTADKPWYYKSKSISGTAFFEPQIGFRFSNFKLFKTNNNFIKIGLAYNRLINPHTLFLSINTFENFDGGLDTVYVSKMGTPIKANKFSLILEYGKNYKLGRRDRLILDVGLSLRLSEADSRVRNEMIIDNKKYEFTFLRSSSHIGVSFRMTYVGRRKTDQV
jgi:hypothetical protein